MRRNRNPYKQLFDTLTNRIPSAKGNEIPYFLRAIEESLEKQLGEDALFDRYGIFASNPWNEFTPFYNDLDNLNLVEDFTENEKIEFVKYLLDTFLESQNLPQVAAMRLKFFADLIEDYSKLLNDKITNSKSNEESMVLALEKDEIIFGLAGWTKIDKFLFTESTTLLDHILEWKFSLGEETNRYSPGRIPDLNKYDLGLGEDGNFTLLICFPLFAKTLSSRFLTILNESWVKIGEKFPKRLRDEVVLLEIALKFIEKSKAGVIIAVVSDEFLLSRHCKALRNRYLENDLIEKIINLPADYFSNSTIKDPSIIIFNKEKPEKGFVTFNGWWESDFEETSISVAEILKTTNCDLRARRYASKKNKIRNILTNSPYPIRKVSDLIQEFISGSGYSPKNLLDEYSAETLPYVRVTDLSKNETEFDLDISKIERSVSRGKANPKTIIGFSAVLVSKIVPKLKPTYFNYTGQPIAIASDVIALKLKKDINVNYFLTQLRSQHVKTQVEMVSSGKTINRISTEDFLNIQIILPSLEEQERQVLALRSVIEEKAIVEEKLIDAQFEVVANINHSLKNKLAVIINDYDTLIRFLRRKERKIETINFADAISANAIGDDIDTVEIITNRLKTNLSDASKVFNNALKIQKQNLKKDVVELVSFFKNEVKPLYAGKNYSINVIAKPNLKLNVWLDKDAFKDVIENLIENAKSHGFVEDDKTYRIVFELSKLEDDEYSDENTSTKFARIVYRNDGKPFPKNFSFEDYKQFSNKAGKTQGTGIGGYIINKMIELHDGRFNFISLSDDFTVEFEILLPLEN